MSRRKRTADDYNRQPLLFLYNQPGKVRLYKYVTEDGRSPIAANPLTYEIGKTYSVTKWNASESEQCGQGLHVATLDWILNEINGNQIYGMYRILEVEFNADDIVAIPIPDYFGQKSGGKLRVKKFTVISELDMKQFGHKNPKYKLQKHQERLAKGLSLE